MDLRGPRESAQAMNDLTARRRARPARKKRFSILMSDVSYEGGVLEIKGRRNLTAILLLGFALTVAYVLATGHKIPLPVRALMSLGVVIPLWGFVDVFFGESYLKWDPASGEMLLRRGSPFGRADFKGQIDPAQVSVTRVSAGNVGNAGNRVQVYQVVLSVELEDAIVNFPLQFSSCRKELSEEVIAEWEKKLSLGDRR